MGGVPEASGAEANEVGECPARRNLCPCACLPYEISPPKAERTFIDYLRSTMPQIFGEDKSLVEIHYDVAHLSGSALTEFRSKVAETKFTDAARQEFDNTWLNFDALLQPSSLEARLAFATAWLEKRLERLEEVEGVKHVPWARQWMMLRLDECVRGVDASTKGILGVGMSAFKTEFRFTTTTKSDQFWEEYRAALEVERALSRLRFSSS